MPWSEETPTKQITLDRVTPDNHAAPGDRSKLLRLTLSGSGFPDPAVVWFYLVPKRPVIKAQGVRVAPDRTKIVCTIDIGGWYVDADDALTFKVAVATPELDDGVHAEDLFTLTATDPG